MKISLEKQTAVITGGSRGIGAATVEAFARAGADVVFSYRMAAKEARALVERCSEFGANVISVRAEVANVAESKKLIDVAIRRFGRLDILVANAGIWNSAPAPIEALTENQWDEMMDVNLKGV